MQCKVEGLICRQLTGNARQFYTREGKGDWVTEEGQIFGILPTMCVKTKIHVSRHMVSPIVARVVAHADSNGGVCDSIWQFQ